MQEVENDTDFCSHSIIVVFVVFCSEEVYSSLLSIVMTTSRRDELQSCHYTLHSSQSIPTHMHPEIHTPNRFCIKQTLFCKNIKKLLKAIIQEKRALLYFPS